MRSQSRDVAISNAIEELNIIRSRFGSSKSNSRDSIRETSTRESPKADILRRDSSRESVVPYDESESLFSYPTDAGNTSTFRSRDPSDVGNTFRSREKSSSKSLTQIKTWSPEQYDNSKKDGEIYILKSRTVSI